MSATGNPDPMTVPVPGGAPEAEIAFDLVRRGLVVAGPIMIGAWLLVDLDTALSVGYAVAVVCANLLISALMLRWAARRSLGLVLSVSLMGYVARLAFVFAAVWMVKEASWVRLVPMGVALIAAHLGLLIWELQYVSGSYAYPGLKPRNRRPAAGYRTKWLRGLDQSTSVKE